MLYIEYLTIVNGQEKESFQKKLHFRASEGGKLLV